MTEQPGPHTQPGDTGRPPGTTATAPPPPGPRRTFRRSRTDRTLAGVCGGIAESLAMDPVIVRVLMVVLTFFGGAGVIVYGACWLLMPEDERESSLAERAIARGGRSSWPVLVLAGVIGLAVVLSAGWVIDDRGVLLIALVVIAAILLARRDNEPGSVPASEPFAEPFTEPFTASFTTPASTAWSSTAPNTWESTPAPGWTTPWTPDPPAVATPLPPLPPRPRSLLGRVTFCLVLVALGVLATIDLAGADVRAAAYPAVVIAGAGLGLLVGARYGRGRWLIALGVLGTLALPPAVFADCYSGAWVDQEDAAIAPFDAGSIPAEFNYRGGRVRLDLSAVDFTNSDVRTKIRVGAGDLVVTVPENVDVVTEVDLVAGDTEIFGEEHNGLGIEVDRRDEGADGPGGGTLTLQVEQGAGRVEVRRG